MNGLSLFANVGIAETYLYKEGIDIVVANELLEERAAFYQHLYPECHMICGDITKDEIFNEIITEAKQKNVEFILATPPCQGMSIAGYMLPEDPRNYLITYAVEAIKKLGPKYVLLENVFIVIVFTRALNESAGYIQPIHRSSRTLHSIRICFWLPSMRSSAVQTMIMTRSSFVP